MGPVLQNEKVPGTLARGGGREVMEIVMCLKIGILRPLVFLGEKN